MLTTFLLQEPEQAEVCVNATVEYKLSMSLVERIIPLINNTVGVPEVDRIACLRFVEVLFNLGHYSFFYTNDMIILFEILIRLLRDTGFEMPIMEAYLAAIASFMGWPEYQQRKHKLDELDATLQIAEKREQELTQGARVEMAKVRSVIEAVRALE
jgi:hypothetical protein